MTFLPRLLTVALAAFGIAGSLGALVALWLPVTAGRSARDRADALFRRRVLPATVAAAVAVLAVCSFMLYEPRGGAETVNATLVFVAACSIAAIATSILRLTRSALLFRKTVRHWMRSSVRIDLPGSRLPSFVIDSAFPLIAVVGVLRPRLVVARIVLERCTRAEMDAIVAHENGHVTNRDNLRRLLLWAAPDLLMWLPRSRRVQDGWHEATEDAADDEAARLGNEGRLHLARALVRVARLAPATFDRPLPVTALYRGDALERRVRRLIAPPAIVTNAPRAAWTRWAIMALLTGGFFTLHAVHEIVEAAVSYLP